MGWMVWGTLVGLTTPDGEIDESNGNTDRCDLIIRMMAKSKSTHSSTKSLLLVSMPVSKTIQTVAMRIKCFHTIYFV